jgi:thioredoxin 1
MAETGPAGLPESFFDLIKTSGLPVLVDFWAEWCGPCRVVSPSIQRLASQYKGRLLTVKVNIDRRPNIAEAFQVQSIPTIMLFWKGEPRLRLVGAYPYETLDQGIRESWPADAGAAAP